jgi:UDP-glucuronate 4-epimerase
LAVSSFTRRIATGDEVLIYGDGSSQRDFTYVSDVVAGIEAALDSPVEGFQSINLSGGHPVSMLYLVQLIEQGLGEKAKISFMPARPEESHILCADLSRARSILNYQPRVSIEDGIALFVAWWKASHSAPAGTFQTAPEIPTSRKRNTVPSPRS